MAEKGSLTEERKQGEQECIPNLFTFFKLCSKLKKQQNFELLRIGGRDLPFQAKYCLHLKRTGWVNHDVNEPETVAGHMYRMSLMSFLFSKDNSVDYNKCIKMSLVHDLAESIVGDLTPSCNVSKEEKHQREKDAMVKIAELVPEEVGQELYSLWMDYEESLSPEAVLVHDLDKFDMIFQAYEYETDQGRKGELQQFFDSTKDIFKSSTVQLWTAQLLKIRQETNQTIEKEKQ